MRVYSYASYMADENPYLVVNIDTELPIELSHFVGSLTSLSRHYSRFIKKERPDLFSDTEVYVKEIRHGSYEFDLIMNGVQGAINGGAVTAVWMLSAMDKAQILEKFVSDFKSKMAFFKNGRVPKDVTTTSELKDWGNTLQAIAVDPNASRTLSLATFEDGKREIRAAFRFDNQEAQSALQTVDARLVEMGQKTHPSKERVLMVYTRADINEASPNKKSGERVRISSISDKQLPIMYSSEMAEARIKHELRHSEFPFKIGFVVDVFIETSAAEKPIAYAVTNYHSHIDLGED